MTKQVKKELQDLIDKLTIIHKDVLKSKCISKVDGINHFKISLQNALTALDWLING